MDEEDYQDLLEDLEQQEEEQPEQPANRRVRALRAMRENGAVAIDRGYGKLFNGASLYRAAEGRTRFFFQLGKYSEGLKVEYNGRDVTADLDPQTCSLIVDGLNADAKLRVTVAKTAVEEPDADFAADAADAPLYDLSGRRVDNPAPGIYIRAGKKVVIR